MAKKSFINVAHAFALSVLLVFCNAGSVNLPSYPLAVKSPYLSTWVPGNQLAHAPTAQPQFWTGHEVTWTILARVNGKTFTLFGAPQGVSGASEATTTGHSYTSSHTLVNLRAGGVAFTLDFFSPVLPGTGDYARQALPYSYLTVSANGAGNDRIQVLSAIDYRWTAQAGASTLNYTTSGDAGFFWYFNLNATPYSEKDDLCTYGSVIFGTHQDSSVTHGKYLSTFVQQGHLNNPKPASGTELAAIAKDFGQVKSSASVTFGIGLSRDRTINYLGQQQTGYHRTRWYTPQQAFNFFLNDYPNALAQSNTFDSAIRSKAEAVSGDFGSQYADIVEASVRQTFGAFELTVPANNLGAEPTLFLKEISSDGNMNTVDIIFQTWPVFVSLNPYYIKFLFKPLLSYIQSGRWKKNFMIHDIGTSYPNALGHDNGIEEDMPLFETSALFILMYAYQKYTGDKSFAQQYSSILTGYADYLVNNGLHPSSQLISVDAIAPQEGQTGLAVQAAIALNAASRVLGNTKYATAATSMANSIYNNGLGLNGANPSKSTHFTYYYGNDETWNVLFPAYSDVQLGLNTFPSAAWDMQSKWYSSQMKQGGLPFAGPSSYTEYINKPIEWGLADWNLVVAGACSANVQSQIVKTTHAFMTNGLNSIPFGTKYYVEGSDVGVWIGNRARSTVGSNFALLALKSGTWGTGY